jgi:hypothetical protein
VAVLIGCPRGIFVAEMPHHDETSWEIRDSSRRQMLLFRDGVLVGQFDLTMHTNWRASPGSLGSR